MKTTAVMCLFVVSCCASAFGQHGAYPGKSMVITGDRILGVVEPKFRIDTIKTNGFISNRMYWFGRDSDMSKEIVAFIECDTSTLCLKDKWKGRAVDCGIISINNEQMHYLKENTNTIAATRASDVITNAAPKIVKRAGTGMKNTDIYTPHKKLGE